MANVYDEVRRLSGAFVLAALDGQPSPFDIDGRWTPHYQGHPRCHRRGAFDDEALIGGIRAIVYLAAMLPVGSPRRRALVELHRKICQRLANPELLCFAGWGAQGAMASDAIVIEGSYAYLRPASWGAADLAIVERMTEVAWSSALSALKVWSSAGFAAIVARLDNTPVADGRWEIDPRASTPELVDRVRAVHDLSEDAATLFLQYLTLADCADAVLAEIDGFKLARFKAAATSLVAKGLVVDKKHPRAQRKCALPGTWETLKPPNPALETWKLPLYDATIDGDAVIAPLGRILPLRPVHTLFADAFERHAAEASDVKQQRKRAFVAAPARDWIEQIAARPDDDALRLVYADWLTERDDPLGEFITLQVQLAALERGADRNDERARELRAAAQTLCAHHRALWTEAIHPYISDARFERGFVVGITSRPLVFAKHAPQIFEACPLIYELVIDAGPVGPVMTVHWQRLGACEQFSRITHLDTTADHYVATLADLELLLTAPYFPRLRQLVLGYHRTNEGFGLSGAQLLAGCDRLSELRVLVLPGLQIGIKSLRTLLESPQLTQLEVLRVPYNGLKEPHAKALARDLANGLAPALRTLDLSNAIASDFVTRAVDRFARNSVSDETAREIQHILQQRSHSVHGSRATGRGGE